jgi:nitrite reductase/ring-hydroxylating ferredoxin subunit
MAQLVPVAELASIRPGASLCVAIANGDVVLFNVNGVVYALHDACARCGTPLSDGTYSGLHVQCRHCGWEYDVRTGSVSAVPDLRIHTFDVTVVGSQLMVSVAGRDADAH